MGLVVLRLLARRFLPPQGRVFGFQARSARAHIRHPGHGQHRDADAPAQRALAHAALQQRRRIKLDLYPTQLYSP
ncbi:hypothetical protein FNT36_14980 [Hymenobacter setariae]|uniref:Uncharacterized protein n=1 Tax=Hymenobacter setariae TaxID=2594794 RepID=A0A558BR58_9BACT|nr:hypothetical protein [Hymenobacter setariae]TVT38973.1 hypothetical protein FNT36_14980 [Hymenobacter setariae]